MRRVLLPAIATVIVSVIGVASQAPPGVARNDEVPAVLFDRPPLTAEAGFSATLVVPPGTMEDPLSVLARPDGSVWVNDDGGVAGQNGGYVWRIDRRGRIGKLVAEHQAMPSIGIDVAPRGFGRWAGDLFTVATPTSLRQAVREPHIIQRIPARGRGATETVCTLPNHGTVNGGVPGAGTDARFGPPGSPFANRFFVITILNNSMYQVTPDGRCAPFATFDGGPQGLAFSADGSMMFVTVRRGAIGITRTPNMRATIVAVGPDGTLRSTPAFERAAPMIKRIAVAPKGFGPYAGDIFFTDWGESFSEGPDKVVKWDGTLWRLAQDGSAHLVASGFSNPAGIAFSGRSIYIADVNRDGPFWNGKWVAEGFLARIDLTTR